MKPKRIYSKVDRFYKVFVAAFVLFFVLLNFFGFKNEVKGLDYYVFLVISVFICGLFIILPKITYFEFQREVLVCKTLFVLSKEIRYDSIRKVVKNKNLYAGLKFTTSIRGIEVHFNKYDDVLISPKDENLFIQELMKRNKAISVFGF